MSVYTDILKNYELDLIQIFRDSAVFLSNLVYWENSFAVLPFHRKTEKRPTRCLLSTGLGSLGSKGEVCMQLCSVPCWAGTPRNSGQSEPHLQIDKRKRKDGGGMESSDGDDGG